MTRTGLYVNVSKNQNSESKNPDNYPLIKNTVDGINEAISLVFDLSTKGIFTSVGFKIMKNTIFGHAGCIVDIAMNAEKEGVLQATITGIGTLAFSVAISVGVGTILGSGTGAILIGALVSHFLSQYIGDILDRVYDSIEDGSFFIYLANRKDPIEKLIENVEENKKNKPESIFSNAMDNGGCRPPKDPIILDLNNDGILETTNIINGIYFDHENDGFAEASAWVGENDGILVIDSNNNGDIDNGTELLTAETLASFDTNEDGIIDKNDTNFANLKILKSDGTLMTLTEAGITSINLNTTSTEITDENGNQQFASGTFTRADGTTGTFGEFLVKTETSNSIATEWLDETDEISDLPDISGRGNIYSLHQAMLRDESGELVA